MIPSYIDVDNIQTYLQIFFGLAVVFVGLQATRPPQVPVWLRKRPRPPRRSPAAVRAGGAARPHSDATPARAAPAAIEPRSCAVRTRRRQRQRRCRRGAPVARGLETRRPHRAVRRARGGRHAEPRGAGRAGSPGSSARTAPGKTTTFNARCGSSARTSGRVLLHGHDVTRTASAAPCAARPRSHVPARRVVELAHASTRTSRSAVRRRWAAAACCSQLVATPGQRKAIRRSCRRRDGAHRRRPRCASRQAALLTSGERRLVELARALAGRVRRDPARRAVVGPRPHRDRAFRPGTPTRRSPNGAPGCCSSSTTWHS